MPTLSTSPGTVPSDGGVTIGYPLTVPFDLTVLEDSVLAVCVGRAVTLVPAETADTSVTASAERLRLRPGGAPRIVEAPSLFADRTELVGVGSLGSSFTGTLGLALGLGLGGGLMAVAFSLPLRDAVLCFRTTTGTSALGAGCAFSLPFTLETLRTLGALLATFGVVGFGTGGLGALSRRFRSAGTLDAVEMVDRMDA
jgi:hypothetical protein